MIVQKQCFCVQLLLYTCIHHYVAWQEVHYFILSPKTQPLCFEQVVSGQCLADSVCSFHFLCKSFKLINYASAILQTKRVILQCSLSVIMNNKMFHFSTHALFCAALAETVNIKLGNIALNSLKTLHFMKYSSCCHSAISPLHQNLLEDYILLLIT